MKQTQPCKPLTEEVTLAYDQQELQKLLHLRAKRGRKKRLTANKDVSSTNTSEVAGQITDTPIAE